MTQEAMHAQMGGETGGTEEYIEAGAVTFGLEYRTGVGAMNDEGICIHVYGNDLEGDDKELLRFDCFRIGPHYHYRNAPIGQNHRLAPLAGLHRRGRSAGLDAGQNPEPTAHHAPAMRSRYRRPPG